MPTFPLTNVIKSQWQMRTDDRVWTFGAHYRCSEGYSAETSAKFLLGGLTTDVGIALGNCLSPDTTVEGLSAHHALPNVAMPAAVVANSNPGTDSGAAVPPNICAVLSYSTDTGDLVRTGRIYLGGMSKNQLEVGRWKADFVNTELTALMVAIFGPIVNSGQTFELGVVRRRNAGVPITPIFVPVTFGRVNAIAYSQRRRTTKQYGTRT